MCWDAISQRPLVPTAEWQRGFKVFLVATRSTYNQINLSTIRRGSNLSVPTGIVVNAKEFANRMDGWNRTEVNKPDGSFGFQIFTSFEAAWTFCRRYGWAHSINPESVIADVYYRYATKTANARTEGNMGGDVFGTCVSADEIIVMPGVRYCRDMIIVFEHDTFYNLGSSTFHLCARVGVPKR